MDETQIAIVAAITVIKDNRLDVYKSEVATLIIKNISEIEDVTIQCAVQTDAGNWRCNIRLEITGEKSCNSDNYKKLILERFFYIFVEVDMLLSIVYFHLSLC